MTKDRDQLTPTGPADRAELHPRRSAAEEAAGPLDPSTGPGPGSAQADPVAVEELPADDARNHNARNYK